ncbi:hypothetical protein OOZ19_27735 [Saccharopolyspora sp. NFXS83]|uniref:hypothetical protein n=1 Tax=Saccharopolyspora sp. NFXS83 TaxID=2993560 RepID=UPI00224B3365|nr:hypothetical protein [Saccharopolyspora sp. NFXS83]MCX2734052.1 hypothetical protein [Saccharopolyspora sp. NFXS83]
MRAAKLIHTTVELFRWADQVRRGEAPQTAWYGRYRARDAPIGEGDAFVVYGDRHVMREHEQAAPAVFGAEHIESDEAEEHVPETVYLPSQRTTRQDEEVTLELRDTAQGDRALLAFTSLRELVDG